MERDTRLEAQGIGERNVARADADLRRAGFLNPDASPDLARAFLYVNRPGAESARRAIPVLRSVLRREPDNLFAWSGLLYVSRGRDPATAASARAALRRLNPLDAPRP
jgi:hypothetical protein